MRHLEDIVSGKLDIEIAYPPNIADIDKRFPGVKAACTRTGIFFAYGTTIFNPSGRPIALELIAHEVTHSLQQRDIGVQTWWDRYLAENSFRLEQELEAHIIEYEQYAKDHTARMERRRYMALVSEKLSAPLYGSMVKKRNALTMIKGGYYDEAFAKRDRARAHAAL